LPFDWQPSPPTRTEPSASDGGLSGMVAYDPAGAALLALMLLLISSYMYRTCRAQGPPGATPRPTLPLPVAPRGMPLPRRPGGSAQAKQGVASQLTEDEEEQTEPLHPTKTKPRLKPRR